MFGFSESKVQRMAQAAEAKIKSLSETDSFGQIFSPIRAFDKSVSHVATNTSPDCVGLAQATGETEKIMWKLVPPKEKIERCKSHFFILIL